MSAYFDLPLNLPHAGTISLRILRRVEHLEGSRLADLSVELAKLLAPARLEEENPPDPEAEDLRQMALSLARRIVDEIEAMGVGDDRLGQSVRNLFECLSAGAEGTQQSLRAGEDPGSMLRPRATE